MRQYGNLILLVALVALFIGGTLSLSRNDQSGQPDDPRRSSFNNRPAGLKAWYVLLQESGRDCRRWTGKMSDLPAGGTLILAQPAAPVDSGEAQEIVRWVQEGGQLCFLAAESGELLTALHVAVAGHPGDGHAVPALLPSPMGRTAPRVWSGRARLRLAGCGWAAEYGDATGPWLARAVLGRGHVVVAADSSAVANENLLREDNPAFAMTLPAADPIWFDEVHQGYGSEGTSLWSALPVAVRRAILQALLALMLLFWGVSRRFGAPLPEMMEDRRMPGEYVRSLARLMHRGKRDSVALRVLAQQLRRDLCHRLGLMVEAADAEIVDAARGRLRDPASLRQLLADLSRPVPSGPPLELARRIHALREEMNLERGSELAGGRSSSTPGPMTPDPIQPSAGESEPRAASPAPAGLEEPGAPPAVVAPPESQLPADTGAGTGSEVGCEPHEEGTAGPIAEPADTPAAEPENGPPLGALVDRRIERVHALAEALRAAIGRVIVGQDEVVTQCLVALLAGGHVLLEGVPGLAKTLLVRILAQAIHCEFRRVQFTPDLMPSDLIGTTFYELQTGQFHLKRGPIFTQLLLADEINRTPAKTQAALLESMEERQVSLDGTTHLLPAPFMVFATQNPIEHEGTYPLPEAQIDRFLMKVLIGYPDAQEEVAVLRRHHLGFDMRQLDEAGVAPVADAAAVAEAQAAAQTVRLEDSLLDYIAAIVRRTRESANLLVGASPRAGVALLNASKVTAALKGRAFVIPDDVKEMALPVLRHRLIRRPEAEIEGIAPDAILRNVISHVEVPR